MRGKEDVHKEVGRIFSASLLHCLKEVGDLMDKLEKRSVLREKAGQFTTNRKHLAVLDVELRGGENRESRGDHRFVDEPLEARQCL